MSPLATIYVLWLVFFLSWIAAALLAGPTVKEGNFWARQMYRLIIAVGFLLLFGLYVPPYFPLNPLWHLDDSYGWVCVSLLVAGFAFAWWSRVTLSRAQMARAAAPQPEVIEPFRKGDMRRKPEKKHVYLIVDDGPYAIVRHPVSTGMMVSALATAALIATAVSLMGATIMILGFWLGARAEDAVLHSVVGAEFDRYAAKASMLLPFGPKRHYEEVRVMEPVFAPPTPPPPPEAAGGPRADVTTEAALPRAPSGGEPA